MKKTAKDPIREDRIHQEAIVDAYGSEEKAMSWYYYLESKLTFPFYAHSSASQRLLHCGKERPSKCVASPRKRRAKATCSCKSNGKAAK
jgi:Calcium binding